MLDGAAARLRFHQLDAVVFEQGFDVIADVAQRLAEFLGELVGARDPFVKGAEDLDAQGMRKGLSELLRNALWGSAGLWQGKEPPFLTRAGGTVVARTPELLDKYSKTLRRYRS